MDRVNGLPRDFQRQVPSSRYLDEHADLHTDRAEVCDDPATRQFARAVATAIKEARPVVTLPPHIYIPFRAKPWRVEDRRILDAASGPARRRAFHDQLRAMLLLREAAI